MFYSKLIIYYRVVMFGVEVILKNVKWNFNGRYALDKNNIVAKIVTN